jgi:hypothetical protein
MGEWVERMTAVLMGAVSLLCFSMLGWEYGVVILAVALIDPRWFDE